MILPRHKQSALPAKHASPLGSPLTRANATQGEALAEMNFLWDLNIAALGVEIVTPDTTGEPPRGLHQWTLVVPVAETPSSRRNRPTATATPDRARSQTPTRRGHHGANQA